MDEEEWLFTPDSVSSGIEEEQLLGEVSFL